MAQGWDACVIFNAMLLQSMCLSCRLERCSEVQ